MKKSAVLFKLNIENLKTLQTHTILKKTLDFRFCSKCDNKDEKYFMKKIQLRYWIKKEHVVSY